MITPIYPKLLERLRHGSVLVIIPCRHGWETAHCKRDDEGSCPYHGRNVARECPDYCGQAIRILIPPLIASYQSWKHNRETQTGEEAVKL